MSVSALAASTTTNYLERNGQEMIINKIVNSEFLKLQLSTCSNQPGKPNQETDHRAIYNKVHLQRALIGWKSMVFERTKHGAKAVAPSVHRTNCVGFKSKVSHFRVKKIHHSKTFPQKKLVTFVSPWHASVRTNGHVRSRDNQNFSKAWMTKFSYPWCSAARARELPYNLYLFNLNSNTIYEHFSRRWRGPGHQIIQNRNFLVRWLICWWQTVFYLNPPWCKDSSTKLMKGFQRLD